MLDFPFYLSWKVAFASSVSWIARFDGHLKSSSCRILPPATWVLLHVFVTLRTLSVTATGLSQDVQVHQDSVPHDLVSQASSVNK